jgi:hypothetical protein
MAKYDEEEFATHDNLESRYALRADNELFDEDSGSVVHPIINVKRKKLPHDGEDWEILVNGKSSLYLKGTRFTNQEKVFLRTVEGMKFLISEYKNGKKSVVKIKDELKKIIK